VDYIVQFQAKPGDRWETIYVTKYDDARMASHAVGAMEKSYRDTLGIVRGSFRAKPLLSVPR
jgi:hypothetical protein